MVSPGTIVTLGSGQKQVYLDSTSSSPWSIPADWSNVNTIEVVGANRQSTAGTGAAGGTGGGAGAYARKANLTGLTPGGTVPFQCPVPRTGGTAAAAQTWLVDATTVMAQGSIALAGGAGGTSVGDVTYSGGNGIAGNGIDGAGGGGGAAGPSGAGGNASRPAPGGTGNNGTLAGGAVAGANGVSGNEWPDIGVGVGSGAAGGIIVENGGNAVGYGAAPGAGGIASRPAGTSLGGLIVITWTPPAVNYNQTVAASTTPPATLQRPAAKGLSASTTPPGTLRRAITRTLAASTTAPAGILRAISRFLTSVTTPPASLVYGKFPIPVSNTPLGVASSVGWTPLSAVDLSDCTLAIFCTVSFVAADGGTIDIDVGGTTSGWLALAPSLSSDTGAFLSRVFYKKNPTASETLVLTNSLGGARAWEGRLFRQTGARNIVGAGAATNDPPSVDAGIPAALMSTAWGAARGVAPYTAGPIGYWNFDWDQIGGANLGEGFAQATINGQIVDPGAFTGGGANRRHAWTILTYDLPVAYNQTVAASTTPPGSLQRPAGKTLGTATTSLASLRRAVSRVLSVLTAPVAIVTRGGSTRLTANVTPSVTLRGDGGKFLTASTTPPGGIRRAVSRVLSALTAPIATVRTGASRILAVSVSPSGSLRRSITRILLVTTTPPATVRRSITRILLVTTSPVALLRSGATRLLGVTTTPPATVRRGGGVALAASTSPPGTIRRGLARSLAAVTTPVATVRRAVGRTVATVTAPAATLRRAVGRLLSATTSPSATARWDAGKPLVARTTPPATVIPVVGALLRVVTVPVASIGRGFVFTLRAVTAPLAGLLARLFHLPDRCSTVTVPAEDRTVTISAEDRSVTIAAEDRTVTVPGC